MFEQNRVGGSRRLPRLQKLCQDFSPLQRPGIHIFDLLIPDTVFGIAQTHPNMIIRCMKRVLLLLFLTVCTSGVLRSQIHGGETPMMQVRGQADTLVEADQAVFLFFLRTSHLNLDSAVLLHKDRLAELYELTDRMGIDRDDVRMDQLDISPDRLESGYEGTDFNPRAFSSASDEPKLTEYHAERNFAVTLRNLSRYTEFVVELLKMDIEMPVFPRLECADPDAIKAQLRLEVLRDARARAELAAKELGMVLGEPMYIGDVSWNSTSSGFDPYIYSYQPSSSRSDSELTMSAKVPDRLTLQASVTITFKLESK